MDELGSHGGQSEFVHSSGADVFPSFPNRKRYEIPFTCHPRQGMKICLPTTNQSFDAMQKAV